MFIEIYIDFSEQLVYLRTEVIESTATAINVCSYERMKICILVMAPSILLFLSFPVFVVDCTVSGPFPVTQAFGGTVNRTWVE